MAEIALQDAAFTGFRVVREHPRALLVWSVYALILSFAFRIAFVALAGPDVATLTALAAQPVKDPQALVPVMERLAPVYLLLLPISLVANTILGAAMIRAVLHPQEDRFGYMRLGRDELRQLGLALLSLLVFGGIYLVLLFLVGLVAGLLSAAAGVAAGALAFVAIAAVLAVMVWVAVRLSLAPPMTFATGRINLFGSWALTRGRAGRLALAYLLALVLAAMVYLLSTLVILAIGAILSGGDIAASAAKPDLSSLGAYFTPVRLVEMVLSAGVSALVWPVIFTPPTAIWRGLDPLGGAEAFA